ncbi:MAG TPA: hypothetical protein VGF23_24470 [Gaiellaceae bacterium]|jgi:hypothetical protein
MRRALLVAVALVGLAFAGSATGAPSPLTVHGILVRSAIVPRAAMFGEPLTVRVDVVVDRSRLDPDQVRLVGNFLPFERVGDIQTSHTDIGSLTRVHYAITLRCLSAGCEPEQARLQLRFPEGRVVYFADGRKRSLPIHWPTLLVNSRVDIADVAQKAGPAGNRAITEPPWRADLTTLPAVRYRVAPGLARPLLIAAAAVLALLAAFLVWRAVRRTAPEPEPEPEPEAPPLPPLERALVLVEAARARGDAVEQRKALELLSEELETSGEPALALDARSLAWSPLAPGADSTGLLTGRVREVVERHRNGHADVEERVNGA